MTSAQTPSIAQKVLKIIRKNKATRPSRLQMTTDLSKEFGFDTFDVVRIIWEVEKMFHISIPDEVPLRTASDFVDFVLSRQKQECPSAI